MDLAVQTVQSLKESNYDYRTIEVDGLYFIALRNRGIQRIWAGQLEQGMYDLTIAAETWRAGLAGSRSGKLGKNLFDRRELLGRQLAWSCRNLLVSSMLKCLIFRTQPE